MATASRTRSGDARPVRAFCPTSSAGRVGAAPNVYSLDRADSNQRRTSLPSLSKTRNPSGGVLGCLVLISKKRSWQDETSLSKSWRTPLSTSTGRVSYR
jgi:hypothetical protein